MQVKRAHFLPEQGDIEIYMADEIVTVVEKQQLRDDLRQLGLISAQHSQRQSQMGLNANNLESTLSDALRQIEVQTPRRNDLLSTHHQSLMGVQQQSQRLDSEPGR